MFDKKKASCSDCVLLVTDGSHTSDDAACFALQYAAKLQCQLTAVFPIDTATMDYLLQMHIFVDEERQEFEAALDFKGKNYLARLMEMAKEYNVKVDCRLCRGRFHQVILDIGREINAGMIVIGGWERNSHHRDNYQTEHELLLELADRPILVVK